jgi:AraC family transcriptional regulator of adaptative response/methylated-DNA-[protein]-cysteine methyltransferase
MKTNDYDRVEKAIRYLEENFRRQPGLGELARAADVSEYHFHRLFTRWAGITPKRFLQFLTAEYARGLLRESQTVLEAAYDAGLSGPGRLHDLIVNVYAVSPGELKEEGAGITIRHGVHPTPFGECLIATTGKGICALSFLSGRGSGEAVSELRKEWGGANLVPDPKPTKAVADRIFDPARRAGGPPLNVFVKGTNFQVRVWEALLRIPPGCVASYEDVAARVGSPAAVRAVGTAVGRNPVAFLIPCHRVIRKTGAFGKYGGGAARKKAILAWEAARFRPQDGGAVT